VVHDGKEVGFSLGAYDHRAPLIIDPVLTYATYLGGTGGDVAYGIAVDGAGDAYVVGATGSTNFPVASGAQTTSGGNSDAFVAKLNPAGTGLIYSTYLGGAGPESATSIKVDASGSAYVAGNTSSTAFPTTAGAFETTYAGSGDGFVAKLSPDGSALAYSSYLGGSGADLVQGITVDADGNAYLTGSTQSSDFPSVNPLQIGNGGVSDAFVTKVSPDGKSLVFSTYLGGSSADSGQAIALDGSGNVNLTGYTYSSDFPTQNAFQSSNAGGVDAFLAAIKADGSSLMFSTYLGGTGQDRSFGMVLDSLGSLYLTGDTQSTDFPTTSNAFQLSNNGQGDVFVCKFSPGASGLVYSTLLGGTSVDQGNAITVDASGNAYVTGFTQSGDFPSLNPLQRIFGISGASACGTSTCTDAFVAEFQSSGELVYSTYLGGSGADAGQAIAVNSPGQAYVAGSTSSQNFPSIAGASQGSYAGTGGSSNVFVAKIDGADKPAVALNPQQVNFGNQALNNKSDASTVTLVNAGSAPLNIAGITASGDFAETNNCGNSVPAGGGTCTIQITFTPTTAGTRTDQITISDDAAGSPQPITVTGTGVASSAGALTLAPITLDFPSEMVGVQSPAQSVRVTNTGKASLTLSSIALTGDFAQINSTCGSLPSALNVGDSCLISVSFKPTGSGKRTGALTIQSNAAGTAQATVSLNGTGTAVFTLAANTRSSVIQIGTTSTTFAVSAWGPSSFTSAITLSCSTGVTCAFDPTSITPGQSSTLTVKGLSATSDQAVNGVPKPLNLTVTGTSGSQTANVALTIFFSDFSVSVSPPLNTLTAGQSASYTVTVTPYNNFSGVVLLGCARLPHATTCTWSPSAVQLSGAPITARVSVNTTTQQARSGPPPPASVLPWLSGRTLTSISFKAWAFWLLVLSLLAGGIAECHERLGAAPVQLSASLRLAALGMMLLTAGAVIGCNTNTFGPGITQQSTGTPTGTYTLGITGTLGNNNSVTRSTTMNLSVGPG
jgi:Beta-propeller repeat/Abnormal spindle-like microcephaly-assoc'd, ASPM-SPD-2-Hydin